MNQEPSLSDLMRPMFDEAVWAVIRTDGEDPKAVVHRASQSARAELIAVLGHRGAAHQLRALANAIEAEID